MLARPMYLTNDSTLSGDIASGGENDTTEGALNATEATVLSGGAVILVMLFLSSRPLNDIRLVRLTDVMP